MRNEVSNIDPTPAFWFGHGLGYSRFEWTNATASSVEFDDEIDVAITVTNTGTRDGSDVVQLYLHDPVASVVRPVRRLIGYSRVEAAAGGSVTVTFRVPSDLASFTGRDGERIVEPGELVFQFGRSAGEIAAELTATLTGTTRTVDHTRRLHAVVSLT
jgi:beta-xylosidase